MERRRHSLLRGGCLVLLTVQTSALILVMRHSLRSSRFIPSSVVVTVEVVKLALAFLIELFTGHTSHPSAVFRALRYDFLRNKSQVLALAIPAFLYAIQNNMSYFALARLSAVSFQVLQQLKILTTALMAGWLMGKEISRQHWVALLLLTSGVIFVQLSNVSGKQNGAAGNSEAWMGFLAMLANSLSSGFAGIYFERLMKSASFPLRKPSLRRTISVIIQVDKPTRSVWIQSIELGVFGLLFSVMMAIWNDGSVIIQNGFFSGYDKMALLVVGMQACGGILVAMVVRYADSILKAFATSASIVLSSFITFGLLGQKVAPSFLMGATLVVLSVYIYAKADRLQMDVKRQ
ncbi:hypothetical protein PSACC_02390 [Paramicrosporidium saccamoebae]|uniref:UDP-galactose transporter n=1 Tax=Paramicrosporidium saccamoebae TaxID=1246581 RepID=A0A2H9TJH4_9FUNG|nr:hypothetical protein PSACC_02390 [Paramicrosporidium saccamoebae]